jgi:putative membrane protein
MNPAPPSSASPTAIDRTVILLTTLVGGAVSSLVKSGSEPNMPPRVPGELSPPAANLDAWLGRAGVDWHALDYVYQTVRVPGAVMLYHWGFSFVFAFVYVALAARWPAVRRWYGAAYGVAITLVMHGLLIPALGLRHPAYAPRTNGWLWDLNGYELWSELIGHVCWSVSIEICLIAVLARRWGTARAG